MHNERIKLLILVPTLECGGLERNVSFICDHINTKEFEVTLAVINNSNPFYRITNTDIRVIDLGCRNVRSSIFRILKLAKETQPAIILSTANHLNLLISMFRSFFPRKAKIIARESSIVSINSKRAKLPAFYDILLKAFYRRIHFIVCQSAYMQEDLVKHYGIDIKKTRIIKNAIRPALIPMNTTRNMDDKKKFITVARLSEEKGLERLIRSVSRLQIPFQYTIIGEGERRNELQQLIDTLGLGNKVFLFGSSNNPFLVVPDADLFLMGSYYEGFPNVMLEANLAGIPAIAFDAPGGIPEVVAIGINGFLVENDNEVSFADTIKSALHHYFDRNLIRKNALELYGPEKIISEWEQLFKKMIFATSY
jgi:glycosyltransferase involved in cell wall biosynthesis